MRRIILTSLLLGIVLTFAAFDCSPGLQSAKLYKKQGHPEKAKESLLAELAQNPQNDEAYFILGEIYYEQKNIDSMLISFDKSLAISDKWKENIDWYKFEGWRTNFNTGTIYYNRAASTTPDSVKILLENTIKAFNDAVKCQPDSAITYQYLGYALKFNNQEEKMIEPLLKLISLNNSAEAYASIGEIYLKKHFEVKKTDSLSAHDWAVKATDLLEKGFNAYPENPDILWYLSNAYIATKNNEKAYVVLRDGIKTDPENKYYRYYYSNLLMNENKYEEAIAELEKAVSIDPEFSEAIYNLGVANFNWAGSLRTQAEEVTDNAKFEEMKKEYVKKFNVALELFNKYLELGPEDTQRAWVSIWKIYVNLDMEKEANEAYKNAYPAQ